MKNLFLIIYVFFVTSISFADEAPTKLYDKIVDDYKKYISTVPSQVRDEIRNFRIDIAKIVQQKRERYNSLSVEAQKYLEEEEKYRKKLEEASKSIINMDESSNVEIVQSN